MCITVEQFEDLKSNRVYFLEYMVKETTDKVNDWIKVSTECIADFLHCSARTVNRITKELSEKGIIEKKKIESYTGDQTMFYRLEKRVLNFMIKNKKTIVSGNISNRRNKTDNEDLNYEIATKRRDDIINNYNQETDNKSCFNKSNARARECFKKTKSDAICGRKTTTCQDMVKIFREETCRNVLVPDSAWRLMVAAMNRKFGTLETWREYCRYLAKSSYFMSNRFKCLIKKVLQFKVIDSVLKKLGISSADKKRSEIEKEERQAEAANCHIQSLVESESKACISVRREIVRVYGSDAYLCWMKDTSLTINEHGNVIPISKNNFIVDYISRKFSYQLNMFFKKG
jgi:predicted transcriptional regulator